MATKKIGIISIGQTPRPDIVLFIQETLGEGYDVLLAGALDELNPEDIPKFSPEDYLLVTSISDGKDRRKGVQITREFLVPLINQRINDLEKENVDIIIIWCAGRFPEFKSETIVIRPSEILRSVVNAVFNNGRLGVIYPLKEQLKWAELEWGREGVTVYADTILRKHSREEEMELLAERLVENDLDLILLNCASFGYEMKKLISRKTGKPVIQTNALVFCVVKELISKLPNEKH